MTDRLALAEELIKNLCDHEGAEGFSDSTRELLAQWDAPPEPIQGRTAAEIGAWIMARDKEFADALEETKEVASAGSLDDFASSLFLVDQMCPAMSSDKRADFLAQAFWPVIERQPFSYDFIERLTMALTSARDGPSSWGRMNEDNRRYWIKRTTDAVQRARQPEGQYIG